MGKLRNAQTEGSSGFDHLGLAEP